MDIMAYAALGSNFEDIDIHCNSCMSLQLRARGTVLTRSTAAGLACKPFRLAIHLSVIFLVNERIMHVGGKC